MPALVDQDVDWAEFLLDSRDTGTYRFKVGNVERGGDQTAARGRYLIDRGRRPFGMKVVDRNRGLSASASSCADPQTRRCVPPRSPARFFRPVVPWFFLPARIQCLVSMRYSGPS